MTDPQLSLASDIAVWASLAVLALALISFSAHLALTGAAKERRADVRAHEQTRISVLAVPGHEGRVGTPEPLDESPSAAAVEPPSVSHPSGVTRRWGIIGMQLTWIATFGVVGGTVLRGLSVQRWPLGNMYEFAIVSASFALVVFALWSTKRDRLWLGPFVVLPVMAILTAGKIWYTEASQLMPALDNTMWLSIHVTLATLSVALFIIGAALGIAFLLRDSAERKGRVRGWLAGLPQASKLETMTYGIHIFAFPLWTVVLITGAIWAEVAWGRYWGWDPKEVWTFVIWAVYAAYLHARATSSWTKRRATWVALVGMLCIILNYTVVNLLITGLHSYSGVAA
ncbi:Cytochrome c-type biogenesis protein CcsA/ResC [Serinicoccus hydrothermalis]|uniref:Cytochrome c-type biogenesis protein CcsA/ResC n=1 Tax=Serinicoccus hydrothermalis TaxID=1758689 RepID=A0A1B1NDB8_9MICO|nr:c-type cytochrome biogenesis protein CcsB [Serinicoccus hydrothermalis]ANS79355.1 Cytochrome c-type biogenesis protein CcsA/ResC [Serinicoccus hydrothermalis]